MTNTNAKRAIIATVDLGFREIEGLMLPDGTYAVAVPQLADVFMRSRNTFSRDLKRLLGEGFETSKAKTDFNQKPINVVKLSDVSKIIKALAMQGNAIADEFLDAILEEGLDRRFAKAFNQKVTEEEYNARIRQRMDRVLARYEYTDFIRDRYFDLHGKKPSPEVYRELTVMVNEKLFGRPHFFCDRDNMSGEQQKTITLFEGMIWRKAKMFPSDEPETVIQKALELF